MKIKSANRLSSTPAPESDCVIIVRGTDDWSEWMDYFSHTGNPHSHPNSYANKVGRMTVMAKFPEMVDPSWRSREAKAVKQGEYPPAPKYIPTGGKPVDPWEAGRQKSQISRMLEMLQSEFVAAKFRGVYRDRRDAESEKRKAQEWLAEFQAGAPKEVSVSPKLAKVLEDMSPVKREAAE